MKGSWLVWLGYSSLFLLAVICMGQLFSAALPKSNLATSISLAFTSPSLVLSGFTWPLIAMPAFYQKLAQIFPLSHFVLGYRNVALMGCDFSDIRTDMIVLAGIAGGCLVCSCILWHRRLERIQKTTGLDVSEETMPM